MGLSQRVRVIEFRDGELVDDLCHLHGLDGNDADGKRTISFGHEHPDGRIQWPMPDDAIHPRDLDIQDVRSVKADAMMDVAEPDEPDDRHPDREGGVVMNKELALDGAVEAVDALPVNSGMRRGSRGPAKCG